MSTTNTLRSHTTSPIKVLIERHVWQKIHGWCKAANSEVSGWALVCKDEKGNFVAYDAFLPKQQCSSGYTDIDDDAAAKLRYKLFKKGKPLEHFRLWWHTHYNFSVFWSGTDNNTAETLLKGNGDWLISLVVNQAGHYKCRADFLYPTHITIDDLDVYLIKNSRKVKRKRNYKADIKRWVRPLGSDAKKKDEEEKPVEYYNQGGAYNGYRRDYTSPHLFNFDHTSQVTWRDQYDAWMAQEAKRPKFEYDPNKKGNWLEQRDEWLKAQAKKENKGSEDTAERRECDLNPDLEWVNQGGCWTLEKKKNISMGSNSAYVLTNEGRLMRKEVFEEISKCHCKDNTCKDCLEKIEQGNMKHEVDEAATATESRPEEQVLAPCACVHDISANFDWEKCNCTMDCLSHCYDKKFGVGYC
jgi:hypothetical protein